MKTATIIIIWASGVARQSTEPERNNKTMAFLTALIKSLRPWQWSKNVLVFAALLFSGNIFNRGAALKTLAAFFLFCLISSAIYLLNDILDYKYDRLHPRKALRPIASGAIKTPVALLVFLIISTGTLLAAYLLDQRFLLTVLAYFALLCGYSLILKHVVIVDILAIALGFLLRVIAGAVVINVDISSWILLCTFFLALFLALNKRRHEITLLSDADAEGHRRVLAHYSPYLLDQMIAVATTSAVVCYTLYTRDARTLEKFHSNYFIITVPFVIYGIFRYLYLVHKKHKGGSPEKTLVSDLPLFVDICLWALTAGIIIYW